MAKLKFKTPRSLLIELRRVEKLLRRKDFKNDALLYGARQALAWMSGDNAQAPSKAFK